MAPDAGVGLVEDRRGGAKRFCGPCILDGQKVAVAQHHFECGEPVLVRSTRSPPHRASAATLAGRGCGSVRRHGRRHRPRGSAHGDF